MKTFSIGFTQREVQRAPARAAGRRSGSAPTTTSSSSSPTRSSSIPRIVRHYGEPFADASAIPRFYVAEMARRHVTVALNGDGGDESFARLHALRRQRWPPRGCDRIPRALRRALAAAGLRGPRERHDRLVAAAGCAGVAATLALDGPGRYVAYMTHLNGLRRERALHRRVPRAGRAPRAPPTSSEGPWRESRRRARSST